MSQTPQNQTPIACNLDPETQAERQQEFTDRLFQHVHSIEELGDGYAYRFPGDDEIVAELTRYVLVERDCCPFFTFDLRFEPDQGPVTLRLRGPEGTKEFLEQNPVTR